jgi:hypothetical protein
LQKQQQQQPNKKNCANINRMYIAMTSLTNANTSYFELPEWLVEFENACKGINFNNNNVTNVNNSFNVNTDNLKTDEEKMKIAIEVSKQSVIRKTGGPFGCAIFQMSDDEKTSDLFCLGRNLVTSANNCMFYNIDSMSLFYLFILTAV